MGDKVYTGDKTYAGDRIFGVLSWRDVALILVGIVIGVSGLVTIMVTMALMAVGIGAAAVIAMSRGGLPGIAKALGGEPAPIEVIQPARKRAPRTGQGRERSRRETANLPMRAETAGGGET